MTVHRTLGRNALWNVAVKFAYIALWVVLTPRILGRLGREPFGFWSLLMLLGGSITFVDLGLTAALTTFTAQLAARGARGEVAAMLARSLGVYLVFGVLVAAVGLLATPLALNVFHVGMAWRPEATRAYQLTFLAFGLGTVIAVFQGVLVGLHRMDLSSGIGLLLAPALLALSLWALRQPQPLPALIEAQVIHALLTITALTIVLFVQLRPRRSEPEVAAERGPSVRDMFRFGMRVQANVLSGFLNLQVDKAIIGARLGLALVAPVELGLRVSNGLSGLPTMFLGALLPALADLDARRGPQRRAELYRSASEPYVLTVIPLGALAITIADPLMRAWMGGPRPEAALALRLLMLTSTILLLAGVGTVMVRAGGRPGLEARFGVTALVLHLTLGLIGLHLFGWVGTLLGGLLAALVATSWFITAVERWLGMPPWRWWLQPLSQALAAAGLASAAAWAVLAVWPAANGRLAALASAAAAGTVFAGAYLATLALIAPLQIRLILGRLRALRPY